MVENKEVAPRQPGEASTNKPAPVDLPAAPDTTPPKKSAKE